MNRRGFISNVAISGSSALLFGQKIAQANERSSQDRETSVSLASSGEPGRGASPRELTVAGFQILASKDVQANERAIHQAIDQAAGVKADFLLTPEGSLSGYYPDFDRVAVADAVERLAQHAKELRVGLLLGTCYKEMEEETPRSVAQQLGASAQRHEYCYDQVRVYAPSGEYLGAYSKILLCSPIYHPGTGEIRHYVTGTLRTFTWDGICFGVLICNDLWATPGCTITPNPYLAWRLRTMGAQVIFHAVGTAGTPLFFRSYQESNESLWAMMLHIPIVTTNANDGITPSNCRAGVITPDGERQCLAHDMGEQFFSCKLPIPSDPWL
ncbi:MAG: carbon-nitrogen hydrolase family protein [Acidobacteria bacterium]|nr:carbon-nitrogen hydrolase family protein [Acidobacteriota bacterium]